MRTRLKNLIVTALLALFILNILPSFCFGDSKTVQGWQVADTDGIVSESSGVITLSGDDQSAGPLLYKEISPQSDFEISLQIKAATLGEVNRDPRGAGEGFALMLKSNTDFFTPFGVAFEFRARGGGQFLLARRNNSTFVIPCFWTFDPWDWTPFVYNTLEYNDGYEYWHSYPSNITENALVKPNVWYTMKLEVQESPFIVTAKVITETGAMLGCFSVSDITDFSFQDIKFIGISSHFGGEFYVRNFDLRNISDIDSISEVAEQTQLSIFPEVSSPTLGSIINIKGRLADSNGSGLANEFVVLSYSFAGIDQWLPISSSLTNDAGDYSIQWVNIASGDFTLKTVWSGNSTHLGTSNTTIVSVLPYLNQTVFFVESNSTVTDLAFNSTSSELCFSVTGPSGTAGFVRVTVAKSLIANGTDVKVYLDGNQFNYSITSVDDSWLVALSYSHSTHQISMLLSPNEAQIFVQSSSTFFQDLWLWVILAVGVLGAAIFVFRRKKQGKKQSTIKTYTDYMKILAKKGNINDIESTKLTISEGFSDRNTKRLVCCVYDNFLGHRNIMNTQRYVKL
jgi:hypothetical protein